MLTPPFSNESVQANVETNSKAMVVRSWHMEQVSYELQIDEEDEVPIIWV